MRVRIEAALCARGDAKDGSIALLRARQAETFGRAAVACSWAAEAFSEAMPLELVVVGVRGVLVVFDEIVGVVPADNVLDLVLSRFCVGK